MRTALAILDATDTATSRVTWGRVAAIDPDEGILVEDDATGATFLCDVLRASDRPFAEVVLGAEVICIVDVRRSRGCVLGVVEPYACHPAMEKRIAIEAADRIELVCGESSLTMSKEGKVVLKGEQIVSRARGVNKIKGAAVKIN